MGEPIYGRREAAQIARMVLEEICGVSRTELLLSPNDEALLENFDEVCRDVAAGQPIQYIIGEADFCDFRIGVREGVLIPRPESEELVRWIVSDIEGGRRLLDIGTGSGALSIALSRLIEGAEVTAIDISDEALKIAAENIAKLAPTVQLIKGDALAGVELIVDGEFDVILSNPPYIPLSEATEMRVNVTEHEPHLALFVPDNDPLIFYRKIALSALKLLAPNGKLYFEIHERLSTEMESMLREVGYKRVLCRLDINDKPRMICAQRE